MKALRLFVLLKNVVASSTCLDCKNPRSCNYSALAAVPRQKWSFFSEECEEESSVYKHALMFKRPSTIKYEEGLENSVSFIGTVEYPLKKINRVGSLGVYTLLKVKNSSQSSRNIMILLKMWCEMAEVSINHLKPNDFIYVWGHLGSYKKIGKYGDLRVFYEVNVKEINYIGQNTEVPVDQQTKALDFHGEDGLERDKNRLHLWQVFFVNPYEWKDFRKTKKHPGYPDFKHKNTGEALWLKPNDPPWISRQLQFLDSVILGQNPEGRMSSTLCSFFPENDSI